MLKSHDAFDVVVIGGGPGGASTAGLLAKRGHRVLVLEREKFPRYHIGESLITGSLPALEELDLRDRLDKMGFTKKYGGTLLWGRHQGTWEFRFTEASNYEYAYQVRRADFDALVLGRARELGAFVLEEATVKEPIFDGERIVGVRYMLKGDPTERTATAKIVIDASGQTHVLARRFDLVEWHDDLRNMAVWTYFQGCKRYGGTRAGDTVTENRPAGWFWFIPLSDGTVSVGYVTPIAEFQKSGMSLEELYESELGKAEEVKSLTDGAFRVAGYRTTKDWSYTCSRFYGPGWALVGDAAAFIDPLLSTGVGLALRGAHGLVDAVDELLRDPASEERVLGRYEKDYRQFLDSLLDFVRYFYDRTKHKEEYWEKAQQSLDPQRTRPQKIDFATMLSGISGIHEIFDSRYASQNTTSEPSSTPQ